jgi:hypothetical protein
MSSAKGTIIAMLFSKGCIIFTPLLNIKKATMSNWWLISFNKKIAGLFHVLVHNFSQLEHRNLIFSKDWF